MTSTQLLTESNLAFAFSWSLLLHDSTMCDFWCVDFWVVTDDMLHLGLFGQASAGFGFGFGCRLLHALEQF